MSGINKIKEEHRTVKLQIGQKQEIMVKNS